jgi:sensor histidine kinase YesM
MRLAHHSNPISMETLIFGTTNLFSVLSTVYLFRKIVDSNSKKTVVQLKRRLIPSFVFTLLAIMSIALFFYFLGNYAYSLIHGGMTNAILSLSYSATISLSVGLFVCCIVFFYATWRQAIEREQKLREENLRYRYRTLKTQINPHFLFNSLNTLSEIVYTDANKADNYIQKLSGVYRFILDNEETDLLPLEEELTFVEHYFSLQKERYGDKIDLTIAVENPDRFKIIPISLQILIENALKHNSSSEDKPLKINISVENRYLIVSNNIQRKNILSDSSGTGLLNLKERVKLIMNREMIIFQTNDLFIVKLPIIDI